MYELARVRLHSVGPSGARYQDVTIDLREVGRPVMKGSAPTLFDGQTQVVRRPSPASVLFAENGNGKTVLVKLIFSVMLPGRKQIVGTSNTKAMDNFVLADDVAHVALEWMHVETGELVVTGKVSAWRDHRVSSDSSRLTEAWYSFRPKPDFTLDDLPFTEHGRLVGLPGYKDRLTEASAEHPHAEMSWQTYHRDWTTKLDELGLDPELFAYQRRMNAGEGEAANAFSFKSDEGFVDWLLSSVMEKDGPRALSEVIDAYATRLAERDEVVAERDFVEGALERLTPLAAAAHDYAAAKDIQAEAARDATRFALALELRRRAEDARLARLADEKKTLGERVEAADREQRRLNRIVLELRRIVAGLRLDEALNRESRLATEREDAQTVLDAWQATDVLLRFRDAHEKASAIREAIRAQEQEAAAPLAARDTAARRLVHGLILAAKSADAAADSADADAKALVGQIDDASEEETVQHRAAEQFKAAARSAQEKIGRVSALVDHAVTDGILTPEEDLLDAVRRAEHRAVASEGAVTSADEEVVQLRPKRRAAETTLRACEAARGDARRAAADAVRAFVAARQAAQSLSSEGRFAALLGADEILLETDAPQIDERLAQAIEEAEITRDRRREADGEDRRILDALGDGGLLPPPIEVTAVRDTLRDAGIACYTGWEYIAQMPEEEHNAVLRLYPHLVDGVVLNSRAHASLAEACLVEARLLPSAAVVVGTTAAFDDLTGQVPAGLTFLVPPNPALYDEDLAETERQRLEAATTERQPHLVAVDSQIGIDRRLRSRLTEWRESYPPGSADALADAKDAATEVAGNAEESAQRAEETLDALTEREDALAEELPVLRTHAKLDRGVADRLAALAVEHANLPGWTEEVRVNREHAALAEHTATVAHATAERVRKLREETIRLCDDHKRLARSHRHEITKISGGGGVDTAAEAPTETIETLQSVYRAAVEAYERVEVGADLRAELSAKERAEAEAQAGMENVPGPIRSTATDLLGSPDGGDAPARAAAAERVRRRASELDGAIRDAGKTVGSLRSTYEQFQPQETTLEPYGRPGSVEHGEDLAARATTDWIAATTRYSEVKATTDALQDTIDATQREVEAFSALVDTLSDSLPSTDAAEHAADTHVAYAGTVADGRSRRDTVRSALKEADSLLDQAVTAVRGASDALNRYATHERFAAIESPVRRQILSVDLDRLYEFGPDWEGALKPRLRSLQDELAQIDRHRNQIVLNLRGHVETALRTLRSAERVSQLPETLGDWAGQHFLRIRFKDPDHATLNERIAAVIDAAVAPNKLSGSGKRDGMSLVLKGVRAALPQGVKVEMLKPDATLRAERVRINEVSDVFSGGQELTAAIILYCTMAALRTNDRGRVRNKHAGVLFLDNPIGRASAGYLLDLQLGVARELGVQLIYTTGLFDLNALAVFPLIVRLRNDQDLRSGKKYLILEDEVRQHIAGLGEPDGTGRITAARLFRRPGNDAVLLGPTPTNANGSDS